jgi:succinate dehydrogenase / fumarate reductase cytochrome b subunit
VKVTATQGRTNARDRTAVQGLRAFFGSDVGLKWLMALTGIGLLLYVLAHMLGNLKVYFGPEEIDAYGEALRDLGGHLVPRTHLLWIMRLGLIAAFGIHIYAAYYLSYRNGRARGRVGYQERRYSAANFASRTMRWTGTIVLLFLIYHLADLTWGLTNPDFHRGDVYDNIVASFSRAPVAILYVVAQAFLAIHIFHGAWSMFQSLGIADSRYNDWRRWFAAVFAAVIFVGNSSIPLSVQFGIIS